MQCNTAILLSNAGDGILCVCSDQNFKTIVYHVCIVLPQHIFNDLRHHILVCLSVSLYNSHDMRKVWTERGPYQILHNNNLQMITQKMANVYKCAAFFAITETHVGLAAARHC